VNVSEVMEHVIRTRRSVRIYGREAVPLDAIDQLIELATWAPSATNRQDWEFVVVTSTDLKGEMVAAVRETWDELILLPEVESLRGGMRMYTHNFDWFSFAPVVIVVTARTPEKFLQYLCGSKSSVVHGSIVSAAMAAQNLMLAAHAMGFATCCLSGPVVAEERLKKLLRIGERRELVCLITLGYPAEVPEPPPRKPVSEISRSVG
jgi:nitroreductase